MEPQSVGQAVRFLRQFATPPDGGRLDAELIERFVAAQDEAAFAQLVERHGPLVLGVCRRVLRNLHDAEDAFQATFLVLARKARHIRQRHALAGWLYKVAYHLSVRLRASAERRSRAERQPAPPRDDRADDQMTWAELRQVLDDEFARLPEKYRAPLLLCCLAGHTRDEAAEQLGWTLGTLKMRLERGRQLLRERLDRRGLTVSATMLAVILAQQATATPVPAALVRGTGSASVMFARGTVPAALSARVVRLAGIGLSAGTTKAMLIGAAAVLIGLLGLAGGILGSSDTPGPTVEVAAANTVRPVAGSFANATEETGLGAILRQHSARYPEWAPTGATLLDIDGDGHLDLHLAGQAEDFAALGRNTGGRLAYVDPRPEIPRGVRQWGGLPFPGGQVRHAFDFNEDRRLDVAISWHNDGAALYHNAATGSAASFRRTRFVPPEFLDIRASALADVNRDGIVDFLTSDSGTTVTIHLGKGDGTFRPEPVEIDTGLRCAGAIPVDLDDDGRLELIARQSEFNVPARRKVLRNTGPMHWTDVTRESGVGEAGSVHGAGDLNRDGSPDLICMEAGQIIIYFNDGRGRFTRRADAVRGLERAKFGPHEEWGDKWGGAVVVDLDNDGTADILINGRCYLYVLRGTGGGAFEYVNDRWGLPDFAYGDVDDGLCFGDVNGDGGLDLVTACGEPDFVRKPLGLFLSRVADQHWVRVRLAGRPGNASATGAKIRLTEAGNPGRLLAYEQVAVWGRQSFHSYYAARQTERHFGLGPRTAVDVSVEFYPSGRRVERRNVPADTTIEITESGP